MGTRPDVRQISGIAAEQGALVVVDASAAAPFLPLDIAAMGADVLTGFSSWLESTPPGRSTGYRQAS